MGREVKRVAKGFKHPLGEVWPGYISPEPPHGLTEDQEDKFYEDWCATGEIGPPEGEGWQMWENVSEGSPISPVLASPEELARWLADTSASACGDMTATYEEWMAVIRQGYCFSGAILPGRGMVSGPASAKVFEEMDEAKTCKQSE